MTASPMRPTPEKVALVGDLHGSPDHAAIVIADAAQAGATWVIQLGDMGVWTIRPNLYLDVVNDACVQNNVFLAFLDGNHENHDLLAPYQGGPPTALRERVYYLPRGTRWSWYRRTWVAVGGATSLDRPWRTPGRDWFDGEALTPEQARAIRMAGRADVMLSHDGPACTNPTLPTVFPVPEIARAQAHRERLQLVMDAVRPQLAVHGHFHVPYVQPVRLSWGRSVVIGLNRVDADVTPAGGSWITVETRTLTWSAPRGDGQ